jgi:protease I
MAKVLMVVAQAGFRDEELLVPQEILKAEKHDVKIASMSRSRATGALGAVVNPDFAVHEANPDFFDAIVVVGGPGAAKLAESDDVLKLLQGAFRKNKIIAAICVAPVALARAGVLAGRRATVFRSPDGVKALRDGGAIYTAEDVTVDGKILTASGPHAAGEFGRKLAEMLKGGV